MRGSLTSSQQVDHGQAQALAKTVPFVAVLKLERKAAAKVQQVCQDADGHRSRAILALALLPLGGVFWWGFALPIPPLLALVWTLLILRNWHAFH